ncbi:MAG: Band 7 protein [Desulfotomaculum sp. 46_80]|nr:MAG: Band 7 protein [Desulfotomaculum sp. 46_80]
MGYFTTSILIIVILVLFASAIRIVQEYERGVIFRLGRVVGSRGPGLILLIPFIERMQKVDLRVITMDVPAQEAITNDNVTIKVNAIIYFQVVNPVQSVVNVLDYIRATSQLSQTTLRSIMGQSQLDEILAKREEINQRLQKTIDEGTESWGIKVSLVEIRDLELPSTMQRAMAAQAEAERERRAKIIHADGEYQASEKLAQAAQIISQAPAAMQLRYLQTIREITTDKASTIVFPLPMDLIMPLVKLMEKTEK